MSGGGLCFPGLIRRSERCIKCCVGVPSSCVLFVETLERDDG